MEDTVIKSEDYCLLSEFKLSTEDYSLLKDLRVKTEPEQQDEGEEEEGFILCLWFYLLKPSSTSPVILLNQADDGGTAPFLVLNENNKMMLFPLLSSSQESTLSELTSASMDIEFPFRKWVHVGCKVSSEVLQLHIDGEIVGEQSLLPSFSKDNKSNRLKKITFSGNDVQGYVHNAKVLPHNLSVKNHYAKDPPIYLAIDHSSASEIEEDSDGVWCIVGGKASCRRIFSLDVVLLNAFGRPVNKEMEVIASLLYAESGDPVEKTNDAEAPLLTSYDGIEFASCDRPSKILHGRASFKLKMSQLSSKCDNRLFQIRFEILKAVGFSFLEVLSPPIRCISRNRNGRASPVVCKKLPTTTQPLNQSADSGSVEFQQNTVREVKPSPLSKRVRLDQEKISKSEQPEGECDSHAYNSIKAEKAYAGSLKETQLKLEEVNNSPSDTESTGARNSSFKNMSTSGNSVSDMNIFRYCLGNLAEKSSLLKEIAASATDTQILEFANQVSNYSGCSHHRHQIIIAKGLIEEGRKTWNMISQNNNRVHWDNAVSGIEEQFKKISCCSTRSLKQQDFQALKGIAGCQAYLTQENFDKLWCWLYPVAFSISNDWANATWKSTSPKWIEGFISKEEADSSLKGPRGLREPGTFVLRFPISRSWPHPDAGSLVVTYVGNDHTIHNRQISVDYIYREGEGKQLQELLLAEPGLSQLGRVRRSN